MAKRFHIIDTTLREGEQAPGVLFSFEDKKKIVDWLVATGISEIELGVASQLNDDIGRLVRYCRAHHPKQRISLWCRSLNEDLHVAKKLHPDCISVSLPVSDLHLVERLGKDRQWAADMLVEAVAFADSADLKIAVGFEDASRAENDFLQEMTALAGRLGVYRIRLADTVGILTPLTLRKMVRNARRYAGKSPIAVHTHNDFGMATANAIAGYESGALWADATILGFGERAGCARLEELVAYLHILKNDSHLSTEWLGEAAQYLAQRAGFSIPSSQPIIGERIFTCETGIHVHGLQKNPATYEPFEPEMVGARRTLLVGAKSGKRVVEETLARLGYPADSTQMEQSVKKIRLASRALGRSLTDEELIEVLAKHPQ